LFRKKGRFSRPPGGSVRVELLPPKTVETRNLFR
jgi:hypothetical protein